jgi:hypothetical protein
MVLLVQDETKVNGLLEKGKHCGLMIHWLVMPWKLQDPGVNLTYEQNNYQMVQRQIYYSLLLMLLV